MLAPSIMRWPRLSLAEARSEPARSTIYSFATDLMTDWFGLFCLCSIMTLKINRPCDLELVWFAPVDATVRRSFPNFTIL